MAIDFKMFNEIVGSLCDAKVPVMIRGRHGIGKSEVVYQTAEKLGLPVVERRASQMTEGDLVGLPSTDGNMTTFNPPEFFKIACDSPVLLFLDEVDRAVLEVRQGIFELGDSRKLNGFHLHPDTLIFAAVNGGEHGAQYQVAEMDPAELDRWTVFDIEPTVEDWLEWANGDVSGLVWDFINQNRKHLEHMEDFEPNKVYPSRRSWIRLDKCLTQAGLTENPQDSAGTLMFNVTAGFVGFEAAIAFNDFAAKYSNIVSVDDVLNKGKIEATKDFMINDHCALIEKMEAEETFKTKLDDSQIQNLASYFVSLPSEAAMKLWTVAGAEGSELENTIRLHKANAASGAKVSDRLVELLTGETV